MIPRVFIRRLPRLRALGLSVPWATDKDIAAYRLYPLMGSNEAGARKGYYPGRHNREDTIILAHETVIARMECGSPPNSERHEVNSRKDR